MLGPISRISLASNIDYDVARDLIFWADNDKGTISSVKRDGTNRINIVSQVEQLESVNGDWLGGIAVDWVAGNIYWSDEKRNIIEVSRLNGSHRYVVVSNVEKPKTIAIDPIAGLLFYSGDKRIGRTGLDGSQPFILANQSAQVTNIVLDVNAQVVYWCEASTDTIMRVDYDGNRKTVMLNHSLENPIAVAVIDKTMYWADSAHDKGSIKAAPLSNLSDYVTLIKEEGNSLIDLKIFSARIQNGTNVCSENNGGCQELCLFNGTHPVCACSHGIVSETDGKTCQDYDMFLIYSRVASIESIHMTNHLNMNGPIPKIENATLLRNAIGLGFDYAGKRIFYSDIHWSSINAVYFNGTNHSIILTKQVSVEGIVYEPITASLFWTTNADATIRSVDIRKIGADPESNTLLVKRIIQLNPHDKPRGIAVESCMSMLYWTNWNFQSASIQRAYITGYGMERIITTDIRMPNAITLDYANHKLYWADARLDKIERADYDGNNRVVITHSTPKHPFAMAIYGDFLFWTDWVLRAVLRANKYSGADVVWLRKDIGRPMGIAAIQNVTRDCSATPCQVLNGGCEDVCNVVGGKIKCECTQGKLADDGQRCIPQGQCQSGQFSCRSNECIPFHLTCDHIKHCMDGSDEDLSYCNLRRCPSDYFLCGNHRCIPANQTCDGIQHCGDGSDEFYCNCTEEHFKCTSGQCILNSYRCDNDPDCPDASDEMGCPREECIGQPGIFLKCENTTSCYMSSWRCDGEDDCWDRSDEMNCQNTTCKSDQFTCLNGQCINIRWRCDNEPDCQDGGSDEWNCTSPIPICKTNQFQCADNKTCIPATWQCDDTPDCYDGSDEGEHCAMSKCPSMFRCPSTGRCIPLMWVCDGEPDCLEGGEDEKDCTAVSDRCPDSMFTCRNQQCIDYQYFCDNEADCSDSSDEYDGCLPSLLMHSDCEDSEFRCENGKCIPKSSVCDLKNDCGDESDEKMTRCQNSTFICAGPTYYRCGK